MTYLGESQNAQKILTRIDQQGVLFNYNDESSSLRHLLGYFLIISHLKLS